MSPSAREQILQRARLNNWEVKEYKDAVTVSKRGHWITAQFGGRGGIRRVSSSTAQFTRGDKLAQVLRLMGTVTIE